MSLQQGWPSENPELSNLSQSSSLSNNLAGQDQRHEPPVTCEHHCSDVPGTSLILSNLLLCNSFKASMVSVHDKAILQKQDFNMIVKDRIQSALMLYGPPDGSLYDIGNQVLVSFGTQSGLSN